MNSYYIRDGQFMANAINPLHTRRYIELILRDQGATSAIDLSEMIGVSRSCIHYWLNKLERWGWITSEYRPIAHQLGINRFVRLSEELNRC